MSPLETLETVQIQTPKTNDNPLGVVTINKSDFVEGEHALFSAEGQEEEQEPLMLESGSVDLEESVAETLETELAPPLKPWVKQ